LLTGIIIVITTGIIIALHVRHARLFLLVRM
jgi:hypothetical protein